MIFKGKRTVEGMTAFLKENSSDKVVWIPSKEKKEYNSLSDFTNNKI